MIQSTLFCLFFESTGVFVDRVFGEMLKFGDLLSVGQYFDDTTCVDHLGNFLLVLSLLSLPDLTDRIVRLRFGRTSPL